MRPDWIDKFNRAFFVNDRWQQYLKGVGTTLLVTVIALLIGVAIGSVVAIV